MSVFAAIVNPVKMSLCIAECSSVYSAILIYTAGLPVESKMYPKTYRRNSAEYVSYMNHTFI